MARNDTIDLAAGAWTQITNADVSALRVQNQSGYTIQLAATADSTAPTDSGGAISLLPQGILPASLPLADLWPGVAGAARVWAWGDGSVSVSHE